LTWSRNLEGAVYIKTAVPKLENESGTSSAQRLDKFVVRCEDRHHSLESLFENRSFRGKARVRTVVLEVKLLVFDYRVS
jgi:hypothetical protein